MEILILVSIAFLTLYLKFACFGYYIMQDIRGKRSKTYYRKNKNKNLIKRYFFFGFKEDTSFVLYYGNIAYPILMALYLLSGFALIVLGKQGAFYLETAIAFSLCVFIGICAGIELAVKTYRESKSALVKFLLISCTIALIALYIYKAIKHN